MIGQKNGGDGRNTTKAQKANVMAITKVIYRRWVQFLKSLNSGGTYAQKVDSFFNNLELWGNICSVGRFIFNELEPCGNIAHR